MNKIHLKIIPILGLIILLFSTCRKHKNEMDEIYDNPGYAIGEISYYTKIPFKVKYHYTFTVDNIQYKNSKRSFGIGEDGDYVMKYNFLVVYLKTNPNRSDLNFDYIIESYSDFENLVAKFQSNPPKY